MECRCNCLRVSRGMSWSVLESVLERHEVSLYEVSRSLSRSDMERDVSGPWSVVE